jgi:hypothetical protein
MRSPTWPLGDSLARAFTLKKAQRTSQLLTSVDKLFDSFCLVSNT